MTTTEKQALLEILSVCDDDVSIESIIHMFLQKRGNKFSALRLIRLINDLGTVLYEKNLDYERLARVAFERATYLKYYLRGELFADTEAAKAHIDKQIENAEAILDAAKNV